MIDCRLDRKKYEKSKIQTAIYFNDILNDTAYLSPPVDNTLIVLYDDDGTFLTSSSSSSTPSSSANSKNTGDKSNFTSDEIISKLKTKINCSSYKTIYILSGGFEQFSSKFPFMCTNLEIRSTSDRHKYLTIYPNCVIENQIYIGSGIQAKNWKIIRDLKVTHIINCSIEHECVFQDEINYLQIKIEDSYQENIYKVLNKALNYIQEAFDKYYEELEKEDPSNGDKTPVTSSSSNSSCSLLSSSNAKTELSSSSSSKSSASSDRLGSKLSPPVILIHCNLGISRSSSILIAYLIQRYKLCLYAAFKYVKDKRLQIAPNYSFLRQLKQFEELYDCY